MVPDTTIEAVRAAVEGLSSETQKAGMQELRSAEGVAATGCGLLAL